MARKRIDEAKAKIVDGTVKSYEQEMIRRLRPSVVELSIDDLLYRGLVTIDRILKGITEKVTAGLNDRDTTGDLKDVMTMLRDLKKEEKELLEKMNNEELENLMKEDLLKDNE